MPDLANCSACGNRVSAIAESCPHCGHPFAKIRAQAERTRALNKAGVSCIIAVVCFIIGGIAFSNAPGINASGDQSVLSFIGGIFWLGGLISVFVTLFWFFN